MTRRFARPGGADGTSGLITPSDLTSGAAHTFGSWSDLVAGASVLRDVCGISLVLDAAIHTANTNTQMLMEVGLGNTGNAVDKTILTGYPLGALNSYREVYLPLHVPAGVRIAARIQATQVNDTASFKLLLEYGSRVPGFGGFHKGEGLNVDSASSGFSHGDLTDNAWEQVVAATSVAYKGVSFRPQVNLAAATAFNHEVDVGMGGSGSEQVIGTWLTRTTTGEDIVYVWGPRYIARPIPAGARLALRKNTTGDLTGTIIGWR